MVSNQAKALKALHQLLIQGRIMAFEGMLSEQLAFFFDDIEYLPALMLEECNAVERFSGYLEEICKKFNCSYIFSHYRSGMVNLQ